MLVRYILLFNTSIMKKLASQAFTLVELLIVIGIIGLLAVTVLLTLNPAEAQKKARDTKRIKDAQTLQAVLEQYINDGNAVVPSWTTAVTAAGAGPTTASTNSVTGATVAGNGTQSQSCSANWLGANMCTYTKSVPTDPSNNQRRTCADASVAGTFTANNCLMFYYVQFSGTSAAPGSDYEIGVRQESVSNVDKLRGDGGNGDRWFEVFSNAQVVGNI